MLLANRAACSIQLGDHGAALPDARASVEGAGRTYEKAWLRLVQCLQALGRGEEAREAAAQGAAALPSSEALRAAAAAEAAAGAVVPREGAQAAAQSTGAAAAEAAVPDLARIKALGVLMSGAGAQ